MNQFGITHDWPGLCALCHEEVAEFNGSHPNGVPIIARWKPNKGEVIVTLNDGSKMRVTTCSKCESEFKPTDTERLMESVIGGWNKECDILVADKDKPEWTNDKKVNHMTQYARLYVIDRVDTIWTEDEKKQISRKKEK